MIKNIIAVFLLLFGLFMDRIIMVGIGWLLLTGIVSLLITLKNKDKNTFTKVVLILSLLEIIGGIFRIILEFL